MNTGKRNKKTLGIVNLPSFLHALKLLAKSEAKYVLVGGVAANLHGYSEGTKDIDILIPKDFDNTKKILEALEELALGLSKEITPEEVLAKPITIIGDIPRVDLLLQAGKLNFAEAFKNRLQRKIGTIKINYVSRHDLIKSKQTGRPKDELLIKELKSRK